MFVIGIGMTCSLLTALLYDDLNEVPCKKTFDSSAVIEVVGVNFDFAMRSSFHSAVILLLLYFTHNFVGTQGKNYFKVTLL